MKNDPSSQQMQLLQRRQQQLRPRQSKLQLEEQMELQDFPDFQAEEEVSNDDMEDFMGFPRTDLGRDPTYAQSVFSNMVQMSKARLFGLVRKLEL